MNIKAIEEREQAATPGPWKSIVNGNTVRSYGIVSKIRKICSCISTMTKDAEFIAHAREDLPALLAEVKRLTAENERLKKLYDAAVEDMGKFAYDFFPCCLCKNWNGEETCWEERTCSHEAACAMWQQVCPHCGGKMKRVR